MDRSKVAMHASVSSARSHPIKKSKKMNSSQIKRLSILVSLPDIKLNLGLGG